LGGRCGGCPYHSFPYEAQIPIIIKGKRETRTFTCKEDVFDVIELLAQECYDNIESGMDVDIAQSIKTQIPFFACLNILFDKSIYKDVQRYLYCEKLKVPPFKGTYGEQPAKWVDRFFKIKAAFAKMEKEVYDKAKAKVKTKR
tara:strand:- start:11388 stop:11816 length:429 start_codon:yes stop_codon:yes gene_type:complete